MRNSQQKLEKIEKELGQRESYLVQIGELDIWEPKDKGDREFFRCFEHNLFARLGIRDEKYSQLEKERQDILNSIQMQGLHELMDNHLTVATCSDNKNRYLAFR